MAMALAENPCLDADFLEACKQGDPQAFRHLFETYKDLVYSFALRFSGDPSRAADITQDIFVKLYSRIQEFRGDSRFETWLYRVVSNACIDEQRRRKRFLPWLTSLDQTLLHPAFQERDAVREQAAETVRKAISKLKPVLRVPVLLRYTEDLSYEEIGEVLGIAAGTVASRLNRAHKLLGDKLQRDAR
jgi:RNA polymerase sigma-70 factor, ECF subfamily